MECELFCVKTKTLVTPWNWQPNISSRIIFGLQNETTKPSVHKRPSVHFCVCIYIVLTHSEYPLKLTQSKQENDQTVWKSTQKETNNTTKFYPGLIPNGIYIWPLVLLRKTVIKDYNIVSGKPSQTICKISQPFAPYKPSLSNTRTLTRDTTRLTTLLLLSLITLSIWSEKINSLKKCDFFFSNNIRPASWK